MKIAGVSAATNAFSSHANPVQVISAPMRLAGRRAQAKRPVPIQAAPIREQDRDRQAAVVDVVGREDHARAEQSEDEARQRQHRQRPRARCIKVG